MAECNWDPNKHGGKPCPIHGSEGGTEKFNEYMKKHHNKNVNDLTEKELDMYHREYLNSIEEEEFDDDYDFDNWDADDEYEYVESRLIDADDEDEFNDGADDFEYADDDEGISVDDREIIEDKVRQQIKHNKVKSIGELRQILQRDTKINQLSDGELNAMVRRIKRSR